MRLGIEISSFARPPIIVSLRHRQASLTPWKADAALVGDARGVVATFGFLNSPRFSPFSATKAWLTAPHRQVRLTPTPHCRSQLQHARSRNVIRSTPAARAAAARCCYGLFPFRRRFCARLFSGDAYFRNISTKTTRAAAERPQFPVDLAVVWCTLCNSLAAVDGRIRNGFLRELPARIARALIQSKNPCSSRFVALFSRCARHQRWYSS